MKLKTINDAEIISLEDFSEEEYRDILIGRNSYVLRRIHEYGDDYGGSHCTDECVVTYEEIIPERILVKDGHFCGVCIYTDYDYMNGGFRRYLDETVLFADGHGAKSARSGFSFSNDDHSRWDYETYYLMERDKAKKWMTGATDIDTLTKEQTAAEQSYELRQNIAPGLCRSFHGTA